MNEYIRSGSGGIKRHIRIKFESNIMKHQQISEKKNIRYSLTYSTSQILEGVVDLQNYIIN